MKKKIYPAKFRKRKARVKDSSKPLLKKKKMARESSGTEYKIQK